MNAAATSVAIYAPLPPDARIPAEGNVLLDNGGLTDGCATIGLIREFGTE
jgi:hypothetical protein